MFESIWWQIFAGWRSANVLCENTCRYLVRTIHRRSLCPPSRSLLLPRWACTKLVVGMGRSLSSPTRKTLGNGLQREGRVVPNLLQTIAAVIRWRGNHKITFEKLQQNSTSQLPTASWSPSGSNCGRPRHGIQSCDRSRSSLSEFAFLWVRIHLLPLLLLWCRDDRLGNIERISYRRRAWDGLMSVHPPQASPASTTSKYMRC